MNCNATYKGAIFDLDGTLLDTLADLALSVNHILTAYSLPTPQKEDYRFLVGAGISAMLKSAVEFFPETSGKRPDEATMQQMFKELNVYYDDHCTVETKPYAGVPAMLKTLQEKGVKLSILSNKPQEFVRVMVAKYFPDITFSYILGQVPNKPLKPSPVQAVDILNNWAFAPAEVCYIGDTGIDMRTGKSAGLYTIGVSWGFRPVAELIESGADKIVDNVEDLLEIF